MDNLAVPEKLKLDLNLPNIVTAIRVLLAGIIVWLLVQEQFIVAGILIIIVSLTDGLDGFLARRLNKSTLGGSLFDLVADEVLFMPSLIAAITVGLFSRANNLMPLNPYLYAVPALAGGVAVLIGVATYLWKRRNRNIEFPTPTKMAKINYSFWLAPLVVAVFGIGPDWLLAALMYLAIISTVLTFYSYLKKGSYVFTD